MLEAQDGLTERRRDARFTTSSAGGTKERNNRPSESGTRPGGALGDGSGPTFLLLLRRGAAGGLVAGLLGHGDGRDDAGLAAQPPLLLLLLEVLQDVLGPLV